jgi:predicted nucleic acid-binding protein
MPNNLLILDNTVLTNFALIERAELVFSLRNVNCATTTAVMEEYTAGITARGLAITAWNNLPVLQLTNEETTFAATLSKPLGAGERSGIADELL